MTLNATIRFFDAQFARQVAAGDFALNPFEAAALPHLYGRVLDFGCGLGNLSIHAARNGCRVVALDASPTAIEHLRLVASHEGLDVDARVADLREFALEDSFDCIVCIGLLMFFDCPTAFALLDRLKANVRPGGCAVVNVLIEGTTYVAMFSAEGHCLFPAHELERRLADWSLVAYELQDFPAPGDTVKRFATAIARRS